ncbi:DUF402 domain-containing protein [Indiicoccus explosivorum]|uniref:DUF402 domain-containing protein n=1 Tax=Indiicoccus explosivorum TaxID=1917864 RepID=UPI00138FD2F3|nr:DUF402 domain-containing protein [Indiicoccus explosivorum]
MLEKKFGDRDGWERIQRKETAKMVKEDDHGFSGHVTLLQALQVTEPLVFTYRGKDVKVLDDGYVWVQHFPDDKRFSLTTMFDDQGEVVQWYVDVCRQNATENGRPYMEDLFLDIIILPDGEVIQADTKDLEEALEKGVIGEDLYSTAWKELDRLYAAVENGEFELLKVAKAHYQELMEKLKTQ